MFQLSQWIAVVAGIATLGLALGGCSEAPEPDETAGDGEEIAAARGAGTNVAVPAVRAETQALIDAYTADVLTSLKRSADFLAAQQTVGFLTDVAFDVVQANGQLLEFGGTRDVLMRRPDRLRIESVDADGGVKQLFFDGKSILVDIPTEDVYVRMERPGTLYAALDYLVEDLGAPAPLEDFMSENFATGVEDRIVSGFYVQRVMLGDSVCAQLAWRTEAVDVQLWIQEGEEPVPCRLVITYKNAEGHPEFAADFHGWNFAPEADDDMFTFTPPKTAERLQVRTFIRELRDDMEGK